MKKAAIILVLIMGIVFNGFCQSAGPMDLVVLLDTSSSMSNSYHETSDYLTGPFLREFLRIGDTFHLISFAETPKLEISRRIEAAGDVEAVIGRLLLMYPLDPNSDVAGALGYAETYSSSLPGNRHRKLILITDGDTPDTQTLVDAASSRLSGRGSSLQYIKVPVAGNGPSSGRPQISASARPPQSAPPQAAAASPRTPARETPVQPAQSSQSPVTPERPAQGGSVSPVQPSPPPQAGQSAAQGQTTPPPQQTAGGTTALPPSSQTGSPAPQPAGQSAPPARNGVSSIEPSQSAGQSPASQDRVPQTAPPAAGSSTIQEPSPSPVQVQGGSPAQTSQPSPAVSQPSGGAAQVPAQSSGGPSLSGGDIPLPLIIALAVLALLILGLIIFFAVRRLHDSPNRVMAQAAAPMDARDRIEAQRQEQMRGVEMMDSYAAAQRKDARPPLEYPPPQKKTMPKDKLYDDSRPEDGPLMLNLFVEDQNTAIGRRNIHAVKEGYTFSVGGGKSDFLIFLVPVPPHIADVRYDGRNCTFIPRKPQYFPDIGSQQVPGCIGKTIRVISDKNYELFVRIERYQDPLKALNTLLRSIEIPG